MITEAFHRDVEDRPIREGRTPPELLRDGDIEYRTCPYAGSRHQHANPMNVSALRQMGAHWDDLCDARAFLRAAHDEVLGVTQPQLMDVWRVSQLGSALPWFFLHRDAAIPAYAAALAKATLGMGIWAQRVLVRTITERWSPPALTAESVLALAEENGTLIGETEVCSGSSKMLLEFFAVLVDPRGGVNPRRSILGHQRRAGSRHRPTRYCGSARTTPASSSTCGCTSSRGASSMPMSRRRTVTAPSSPRCATRQSSRVTSSSSSRAIPRR